jgi:glycosyltransferase involved in cell wall biosynthesis
MGLRLLILSYPFYPSVGGIETVSQVLAEDLAKRGFSVTVITQTPSNEPDLYTSFRVVRQPRVSELLKWISWSDVVLQNHTSLRLAWPLYLFFPRKPFLLVHQTPITRPNGIIHWHDRLKRTLLRRAYGLSVSHFMAESVKVPSKVIFNPFADDIFNETTTAQRTKELLFVGRLVPAKGVDILLRALSLLAAAGLEPALSIVGLGSEEERLMQLAKDLNIQRQVCFLGPSTGRTLAEIMNQHAIIVIPSRENPPEAFGVVAVEGIACGCVAVASRQGGLPDAVGPCGVFFENENPADLASKLMLLLQDKSLREQLRAEIPQHIARFKRSAVTEDYVRHIQLAMGAKWKPSQSEARLTPIT